MCVCVFVCLCACVLVCLCACVLVCLCVCVGDVSVRVCVLAGRAVGGGGRGGATPMQLHACPSPPTVGAFSHVAGTLHI